MEKADGVQSEQLATEQNGQNGENEGIKDDSKLPQFPPVLLQKIASMVCDGSESLELRERIRFASVNRLINAAVRSSIDGMERRPIVIRVQETYVELNDIKIKSQPSYGYEPTECIDALLAFGRPNQIHISSIRQTPQHRSLNDSLQIVERMLASIPPSSILRVSLGVDFEAFDEGTPFYGILTHIGKMVNLEMLTMFCFFIGNDLSPAVTHSSSPTLPAGSPFLQLRKLEKLRTLHLYAPPVLTEDQMWKLIKLSLFNLTKFCWYGANDFSQLMTLLDDRARADLTNGFSKCTDHPSSQLPLWPRHLPQCIAVGATTYPLSFPIEPRAPESYARFVLRASHDSRCPHL